MLYLIFAFIFGTCLGSFINMAVYRINKDQNFGGRSYCDYCKKPLSGLALIPFFSYFFLRGKSNCCNKKLSLESPIVELISGLTLLFIALYYFGYLSGIGFAPFYTFSLTVNLIYFLYSSIIFVLLATIFIYDLKFMQVPMLFVYIGYFTVLVFKIVEYFIYKFYLQTTLSATTLGKYILKTDYIKNHLAYFLHDNVYIILTSIVIALFFAFLVYITKGKGMGTGDIFVAPLLSLMLPYFSASIFYVLISFIIGGVFGSFILIFKKGSRKTAVPFIPFLISGFVLALIFGDVIINSF